VLTKHVLESALDAEMTEHLGYDKHDWAGRGSCKLAQRHPGQEGVTEIGPVEIEVLLFA
jgi:putative transposase